MPGDTLPATLRHASRSRRGRGRGAQEGSTTASGRGKRGRGGGRKTGQRSEAVQTEEETSEEQGEARERRRGTRRQGRGTRQRTSTGAVTEERQWSLTPDEVLVRPFVGSVGPTAPISADPTELFLQLFTPGLIDEIVRETNRYAALCLQAVHSGDGPVPTWETNGEELKAYFGFSILMGMNRLPDLYDYWSVDERLHYFPIASRISRKRFLEIQRYLHFRNNDTIVGRGEPGYDRLAKVRPVIEILKQSFLSSYNPHRENSIDEAMIKFKGQSSLKQYLPKKPIKRGFKVWVRADGINGFICDLDVYTGKEESMETGLGAKVVKKLSRPLVGGKYHLYFDNFFSSVKLFEDLLDDDLYACGTFRRDRKHIPAAVQQLKLGKHAPIQVNHVYCILLQTLIFNEVQSACISC